MLHIDKWLPKDKISRLCLGLKQSPLNFLYPTFKNLSLSMCPFQKIFFSYEPLYHSILKMCTKFKMTECNGKCFLPSICIHPILSVPNLIFKAKVTRTVWKITAAFSLSVAMQWLSLNTLTESGDLFMAKFSSRKQAWFIIDQVYWKAKKKLLIRKWLSLQMITSTKQ